VSAPLRENVDWTQPLVNSATTGQVALACRERDGFLEFLVSVAPETGLATSAAVAPSYVRYPGIEQAPPHWLGEQADWCASIESDEGGRFYRDASRYQIVRVDDAEIANGGLWLRLPELKALLRMSNVCTIQLRGVVSQLLGAP
jgi:dTDP-4-dehydro-6-deoxy-alpha-D-glucopyranose 2,3-dehydratase